MPDSVEEFLRRYAATAFRHRDELLAAIQSGRCTLHSGPASVTPLPASHFQRIYQIRARRLADRTSLHALSLREDVLAFLGQLGGVEHHLVGIWSFFANPHTLFAVFEDLETGRILGCIGGADRRLMSEAEWDALWADTG